MKMLRTVTGLDIGSSKICAARTALDKNGSLCVLGIHASPSKGVERGHIVDLDDAVESIAKTLESLREKTRKRPENICLNVSSQTLQAQDAHGMVRLSLRGREITKRDISKCIDAACTIQLPFHRDIIHRVIQRFYVDDDIEVKNPFGLYGSRLTAKILAVTASASHLQTMQKALSNAGYQLREFIFSGLADSAILFDTSDRSKNQVLIDIGSSLTEISVFEKGILNFIEVLPIGGTDINGSIVEDKNFNKITSVVKKRIELFRNREESMQEIVLTGGISLTDGIVESIEKETNLPVRIGMVRGVVGSISNSEKAMATTCLGLAKYIFEKYKTPVRSENEKIIRKISSGISDLFSRYF